jgi:hypothetical protein
MSTGTEASGGFYSRRIKNTADSTSVWDIDLVFILFGFENKVNVQFVYGYFRVVWLSIRICLFGLYWKKLLDVHCVLYC